MYPSATNPLGHVSLQEIQERFFPQTLEDEHRARMETLRLLDQHTPPGGGPAQPSESVQSRL
jgi:hypothetical protein